jgi:NhaP-type Na+/H+ or K+/H+ antiporter
VVRVGGQVESKAETLITVGVLLLLGLVTEAIGHRTRLPRVTLLLIFGFAIGPSGLGFISPSEGKWFSIVADMALIMIGFLLGEKLTLSSLREHGKFVLWLSIAEVVGTALVVLVGIGLGIPMAYLTGRIKPGEPTLVEALGH